jgi:5-carboxymethyl-2-hydroxymuconate isomerase
MPHFHLEYSANLPNLDPAAVLGAVNHALAATGHFTEADIKSRAMKIDAFQVGTAAHARGFVAGKLALLSGRPAEVKAMLSAAALDAIQTVLAPVPGVQLQVSVEIVDIDRASYAKTVLEV